MRAGLDGIFKALCGHNLLFWMGPPQHAYANFDDYEAFNYMNPTRAVHSTFNRALKDQCYVQEQFLVAPGAVVLAVALGGLLALTNCARSPSATVSSATELNADDRHTTGYSSDAIAFDKAIAADTRGEYAAAIRFRHVAWSTRRISRGDDLFFSRLEVANAVDDITLGNYVRARSELRIGVQPYFLDVSTRMPVLARGLQQPGIADYKLELKLTGEIDRSHPSCIDDLIRALKAASHNHYDSAKRSINRRLPT